MKLGFMAITITLKGTSNCSVRAADPLTQTHSFLVQLFLLYIQEPKILNKL